MINYENYHHREGGLDNLYFSAGRYLLDICGSGLTHARLAERWLSEFRDVFHEGIWRRHHERLNPLQAKAIDFIVTCPNITRSELYDGLIPFISCTGSAGKSPVQIAHETVAKFVPGPYVSTFLGTVPPRLS